MTREQKIAVYLNDEQLDEIVKVYIQTPTDEEDRKIKMMMLSLVSDLRNARADRDKLIEGLRWVKQRFDEEWTYELGTGEVVEEILYKFYELGVNLDEANG